MAPMQKKSVTLSGHGTSVALEPEFWRGLQLMAEACGSSLGDLLNGIDEGRGRRSLASACRVAVLGWAMRDRSPGLEPH